jgi:hypothetical protein
MTDEVVELAVGYAARSAVGFQHVNLVGVVGVHISIHDVRDGLMLVCQDSSYSDRKRRGLTGICP